MAGWQINVLSQTERKIQDNTLSINGFKIFCMAPKRTSSLKFLAFLCMLLGRKSYRGTTDVHSSIISVIFAVSIRMIGCKCRRDWKKTNKYKAELERLHYLCQNLTGLQAAGYSLLCELLTDSETSKNEVGNVRS